MLKGKRWTDFSGLTVHFWPMSACHHRQLWIVLCRSWLRSVLVKSDANGWSSQCNYPVFSVSLRSAPGRAFVLRIEPGQTAGQSRPFGLQSLTPSAVPACALRLPGALGALLRRYPAFYQQRRRLTAKRAPTGRCASLRAFGLPPCALSWRATVSGGHVQPSTYRTPRLMRSRGFRGISSLASSLRYSTTP